MYSRKTLPQLIRDSKVDNVLQAFKEIRVDPKPKPYVLEHITQRSSQAYYTKEREPTWPEKYSSRQVALTTGQMWPNRIPYKALGAPTIDTGDLICDTLREAISETFMKEYTEFVSPAPVPDCDPKTVAKDATTASELKTAEAAAAIARIRRNGMEQIIKALQETNDRVHHCSTGRRYLDHIDKTNMLRELSNKELQAAKEALTGVRVRQVSMDTMYDLVSTKDKGVALDKHVKAISSNLSSMLMLCTDDGEEDCESPDQGFINSAELQIRLARKQKYFKEKLEHIYKILCALHNIRPKHLRSKNPLSQKTLSALQRDPFVPKESLTQLLRSDKCEAAQSAKTAPPGSTVPPDTPPATDSVVSIVIMPTHQPPPSSYPSPNSDHGKSVSLTSTKRTTNKHEKKAHHAAFRGGSVHERLSSRVETWEDLLNVGRCKKQPLVKKFVPWHQDLSGRPSIKNRNKVNSQDAAALPASDVDVNNLLALLREDLAKSTDNQRRLLINRLEIEDINRLNKFKVLLSSTRHIKPLDIPERYFLRLRKSLNVPDSQFDVTTDWYETLKQEYVTLQLATDDVFTTLIHQVRKFVYEHWSEIPHIREKMCLLVFSLNSDELCLAPCQSALKFIMQDYLDWSLPVLKQWIIARHLYLLAFVEEGEV